MASASSSQYRCVFVGNIPYDASEEQLIQICEEVGPVVSFRLVLDRETGKPKGYGFCEYKDEETALSARRNLQGYEINGRQLRVDFAENDKGSDRNREQGRGGPGLTSNIDAQKPIPGPPILGDATLHQPVGLTLSAGAASVMDKALTGIQSSSSSAIQNDFQSISALGNDPLTHFLGKMSRYQLNEIMDEMKALATQNKPLARQLLQGSPQLLKFLFQAQIMLGLVNQQMMQMASNRHSSSSIPQPSLQDRVQEQKSLPPLPAHIGQIPSQREASAATVSRQSENQVSNLLQNNPMVLQMSAPPLQNVSVQPQFHHPSPPQAPLHMRGVVPGKSEIHRVPTLPPHSLDSISVQPQPPPLPTSKGLISQIQPSLLQYPRPPEAANTIHPQMPRSSIHQPLLPHVPKSQNESSNLVASFGLDNNQKKSGISASTVHDLSWPSINNTHSSVVGLIEQTGATGNSTELIKHPAKRPRLEEGNGAPRVMDRNSSIIKPLTGQSVSSGLVSGSHTDWAQNSEKQMPQLPSELESALLQQVMNLTPEQLSSLPIEQQQQVLQLQQMLR